MTTDAPTRTTSPGRRLHSVLEFASTGLRRRAARMWRQGTPGATYRRWLAVSHTMLRATVPLLVDAQAECARRDDAASAALLPYYAEQAGQEHGHDAMSLADHERAGGDPGDIAGIAPAAVARLVGAQYYWIRHEHPLALAGHIAALEWFPPDAALVARLTASTGLPEVAFSTLALHAAADAGHGAALLDLLDGLALSRRLRDLLSISALTTLDGLHGVIDEITQEGGRP